MTMLLNGVPQPSRWGVPAFDRAGSWHGFYYDHATRIWTQAHNVPVPGTTYHVHDDVERPEGHDVPPEPVETVLGAPGASSGHPDALVRAWRWLMRFIA